MARHKRPAALQKQLDYATKRAAYVAPAIASGTTVKKRPKEDVTYKSYTDKIGTTNALYTVVASLGAITFFGGIGALGLTAFDTTNARIPRFFRPAKIHATIGATNVTYATAKASTRSYPKYTATPTAEVPSSYAAPISAADLPSLLTLAKGVITAKQGSVGGAHGRLWFSPEYSLVAENGTAA